MTHTKIPKILNEYWKERFQCSTKGADKYFYYLEAFEGSVASIASLTKDKWETNLDGLLSERVSFNAFLDYNTEPLNAIVEAKGPCLACIEYFPYVEIYNGKIKAGLSLGSSILIYKAKLPLNIFMVRRIERTKCGCY